jgi:hypothetical protein
LEVARGRIGGEKAATICHNRRINKHDAIHTYRFQRKAEGHAEGVTKKPLYG